MVAVKLENKRLGGSHRKSITKIVHGGMINNPLDINYESISKWDGSKPATAAEVDNSASKTKRVKRVCKHPHQELSKHDSLKILSSVNDSPSISPSLSERRRILVINKHDPHG